MMPASAVIEAISLDDNGDAALLTISANPNDDAAKKRTFACVPVGSRQPGVGLCKVSWGVVPGDTHEVYEMHRREDTARISDIKRWPLTRGLTHVVLFHERLEQVNGVVSTGKGQWELRYRSKWGQGARESYWVFIGGLEDEAKGAIPAGFMRWRCVSYGAALNHELYAFLSPTLWDRRVS